MLPLLINRVNISAGRFVIGKHGDKIALAQILVYIPERAQNQPMPIKRQTDHGFAVIAAEFSRSLTVRGVPTRAR